MDSCIVRKATRLLLLVLITLWSLSLLPKMLDTATHQKMSKKKLKEVEELLTQWKELSLKKYFA